MPVPRPVILLLLVLGLCSVLTVQAAGPAEAMRLMKSHCFSCHNPEKKKGGLVMTSREGLLQGGDNGPALVDGAPDQSEMIASLEAGADPHMPPKKQLAAAQIETLRQWVKEGAKWDAAALAEVELAAPREVKLSALPGGYHPVLALALSPDGKRLAVGCAQRVLLFAVEDTKLTLQAQSSAHPDPVQSLAWSPDGARLASGAFRRAVIWQTAELKPEREIATGLTDRLTAVRFLSADKLLLADGQMAQSGIVRLAEVTTGAVVASWQAHADTIFDMAVSADGKLLATAGGDKLVKLWNLETRKETARLEGHVAQVLGVAFNQDGTQLLSGGADLQLKVWDVKTKERIITLGTHTSAITAVAWANGGPTVFAASGGGALLSYTELKAHTGDQSSRGGKERKWESSPEMICSLAAAPDGNRIFAGLQDGRVLVWKDAKLTTTVQANEVSPLISSAK